MKKLLIAFLFLASIANAANTTPEDKERTQEVHYVKSWCSEHNGEHFFNLSDMIRIDCLTKDEAIEFDWAHKWYEAIGQSLYYGMLSWRHAAVVLIIGSDMDLKYAERASQTVKYYDLPVHIYLIQKER